MRILFIFIGVLIAMAGAMPAVAQADDAEAIVNKRPLSARVLGGDTAQPGEYPSIVALVKPGFQTLDARLFCGGTLVADRWVLTAAHCLYDFITLQPLQPDRIRVVAGITDLALETPEAEVRVVQVIIHPDFDNSLELPRNDIALLELETSVSASFAKLFAADSDNYSRELGFIAGWGAIDNTDEYNPVFPTALQDAVVPLVSDEICNGPDSYDGLIARSHLCAGYIDGMIDACSGDSGGPLYVNVNGIQVQMGITSYGIGCGLPLFYGIYTDVSYFIPWLSDYISVPVQSSELLAKRAAEGVDVYASSSSVSGQMVAGGSGAGETRTFMGSVAGLSLWMLIVFALMRGRHHQRVGQLMNSLRI